MGLKIGEKYLNIKFNEFPVCSMMPAKGVLPHGFSGEMDGVEKREYD